MHSAGVLGLPAGFLTLFFLVSTEDRATAADSDRSPPPSSC